MYIPVHSTHVWITNGTLKVKHTWIIKFLAYYNQIIINNLDINIICIISLLVISIADYPVVSFFNKISQNW